MTQLTSTNQGNPILGQGEGLYKGHIVKIKFTLALGLKYSPGSWMALPVLVSWVICEACTEMTIA